LEVNVKNDSENMIFVTTEDFRIKNKESGNYLTKEETRNIFPPNAMTNYFIDFARLRPRISDTIPGEQLHFTAEFSVATAKQNNMYNVVSKCSYGNTMDAAKIASVWEDQEQKLRSDGTPDTDIEFQKKNYYLLDAQRQFVENSFDFVIQTVGIYDNVELIQKACIVLQNKFVDLVESLTNGSLSIRVGETSMENCYDIILENEDYTVGKILEYNLYERFYTKDQVLSFCGFKKFHPHNLESVVRIAFTKPQEMDQIKYVVKEACMDSQNRITEMYHLFESRNSGVKIPLSMK
jgi:DNA-directed RNA polymerase subunit L